MKFEPRCEPVEESVHFADVDVLRVDYDIACGNRLTVQLESTSHGVFNLVFNSPEAVRIMDEGQVCEFWNTYSTPHGWLWRVVDGGWCALESQRDQFWLGEAAGESLKEYLVVGDQCVFVLTMFSPIFEASQRTETDHQ